MEEARAAHNITALQGAFQILTTLQLTAALWPPQARVHDGESYDYIVVGAGSAGCVLASRLSEHPALRVLLVEAGGDPPLESVLPGLVAYLPRSKRDWNYTSANDEWSYKSRASPIIAGKMLGGTSSLNYMSYVRGHPQDYHAWAMAADDPSWEWKNVLPYFMKSERLEDLEILHSSYGAFHGTDGYLGVTRELHEEIPKYLNAFGEVGHKVVSDINGYDTLGYVQHMYTVAGRRRQSTAYAFLSPAKHRSNLYVLKNTQVTKIVFDNEKKAVGVEAITEGKNKLVLKASREVILSAGAFNSPQLLMLSGIGPKEHLRSLNIDVVADLPVGQNMQDHVGAMFSFKMGKWQGRPPPPFNPEKYPGIYFTGLASIQDRNYPLYETENFVVPPNSECILDLCSFVFGLKNDICQTIYEAGKEYETLFTMLNILHPKSRGKVLLRSTNPLDPPLIYTHYYSDNTDLEDAVDYIEDFLRVMNSTHFRRVGAELVELPLPQCAALARGSRDFWRCYARSVPLTMFHHSGTCAMGPVLDARLRVRGVRGLRVADASAMPHITSGNTNAPVIMLAEKASDMIKQDLHVNNENPRQWHFQRTQHNLCKGCRLPYAKRCSPNRFCQRSTRLCLPSFW